MKIIISNFEIINDIILEKFDGTNSFDITWYDIREKYAERDLVFPFGRDLNFKPFYIKSGWDVKWIKESNAWEDGYDRYEFKEKI